MKRAIQFLNNTIEAIASIRAGFTFAVLGTLTQTAHTWFIALQFSSFEGILAAVQAVFMSLFLSGGLLFYIVRSGSAETVADKEKYGRIANAFMSFEIFINLFYWIQKIVFIPLFVQGKEMPEVAWYELIIAVPFAVLIPLILKTYGGEINLKELRKEKKEKLEVSENSLLIQKLEKDFASFKQDPQPMKIISVDSDNKQYTITFSK